MVLDGVQETREDSHDLILFEPEKMHYD